MDIPADLIYSHAGYDITSYFWSAFIEVRENGWQCCLRTLWVEFQWLVYIYYIYIYIKCLQRNKIQTICACETAPSRRTLTRILRAADFVTGASVCTAIDWTGVGLCKTKRKFWMTDNPLNCGISCFMTDQIKTILNTKRYSFANLSVDCINEANFQNNCRELETF